MNERELKELLDICFVAKRITETMTDLPEGMKPRHIHVIDAIYELSFHGKEVCVSDISKYFHITMPSVTKLINELVHMDVVLKYEADGDKRNIFLRLTDKGIEYEKIYITDYHALWAANMTEITEEQVATTVEVIKAMQRTMPKGGNKE